MEAFTNADVSSPSWDPSYEKEYGGHSYTSSGEREIGTRSTINAPRAVGL